MLLGVFTVAVVLAILPIASDTTAIKYFILQSASAGLALVGMWDSLRRGRTLELPSRLFFILTAYVAIFGVMSVFAINRGFAFSEFNSLVALYLLYLVTSGVVRTPGRAWGLVTTLCGTMVLATLYGFAQRAGLDPFSWQDPDGILREGPATFGNPNFASHVLVLAVLLGAGLGVTRRAVWPFMLAAISFVHFGLTHTRSALLGLAAAVLLLLLVGMFRRFTPRPERIIALSLTAFALLVLGAGAAVITVSTHKYGAPLPLERSLLLRIHSFEGAARMIQERPLLGRGLGGYFVENPRYWTQYEKEYFARAYRMNDHVHNEGLEAGVEGGLAGAVLYMAFMLFGVVYSLRLALTARDRGRSVFGYAAGACFLAAWVDGQFGFNLHTPVAAAWLFMLAGMIAGLSKDVTSPAPPRVAVWRVAWRVATSLALIAIPAFGLRALLAQLEIQQGYSAMGANAYPQAKQAYQRAIALTPYDWSIWYGYGRACLALHEANRAMSAFERTLQLNPTYLDAHIRRAQQLFNQGIGGGPGADQALDQAIEEADKAAVLAPQYADVVDIRARIQFVMAERIKAKQRRTGTGGASLSELHGAIERDLRTALELNPTSTLMLKLLAQNEAAMGQRGDAAHALYRAVCAEPGDAEMWSAFFGFSRKFGFFGPFLDASKNRLGELETSVEAQAALASRLEVWRAAALEEGMGDHARAHACFRNAVAHDPEDFDAWTAYHSFALANGLRDAFLGELEMTAMARSGRPAFAGVPGLIAILRQGPEAWESSVDRLATLFATGQAAPWFARVCALEASAAHLRGERLAAIQFRLGTALAERSPDIAHDLLATALPNVKRSDAAACAKLLAKLQLQLGDARQAIKTAQLGVERAPNDLELLWLRAKAYAFAGQPESARIDYDRLLKIPTLPPEIRQALEQELAALN